tara:strand:+ start:288 stop:446 length:159 start_codon:yes stop_codon:yes gene_type:complete
MKLTDLSGDGKITQKDKLIGAGVLDKDGNKVKKKFFNGGKVHASFGTDFDDR